MNVDGILLMLTNLNGHPCLIHIENVHTIAPAVKRVHDRQNDRPKNVPCTIIQNNGSFLHVQESVDEIVNMIPRGLIVNADEYKKRPCTPILDIFPDEGEGKKEKKFFAVL